MSVEFQDFSVQVKEAVGEKAAQFLEEAAAEIESAAKRNSRVDTGQLKGSWDHQVNESAQEATIGSPLQNAIWEEFGTGEYAAGGDGRKGGWYYVDSEGNGHFTHGKKPNHTLQKAFDSTKAAIIRRAKQIFGELGS
jgi:hypothetical protein